MDLVVNDVHDIGGEKGRPPNDDHAGDLGLSQIVGVSMHIYQCHLRSYINNSGHCQSVNDNFCRREYTAAKYAHADTYPIFEARLMRKYKACLTNVDSWLTFSWSLEKIGAKLK